MSELMEDEWIRTVTTMIVLWMVATAVAGGLLLTVGRAVFL